MAKKRYITDIIWSDTWFEELEPNEKLLFIYLLTNQQVSICWIYEISLKKIEFETWINKKDLSLIFNKFEKGNKIFYSAWFIVIVNFIKNQWITSENDNLFKWIKRELEEIGLDKLKAIVSYKGLARVLQGAYKGLEILNLTLLNLTLLNLTWLDGDFQATENQFHILDEHIEEWKVNNKKDNIKKSFFWQLQNVELTNKEYEKLVNDFWKKVVDSKIEDLSLYEKIWKYEDHNLVIRKWLKRDWIEKYDFSKMWKNEILDLYIKTKWSILEQLTAYNITIRNEVIVMADLKWFIFH